MENKINIAEILRDCPKGTKLYSPLFGTVTFECCDINSKDYPIRTTLPNGSCTSFSPHGTYISGFEGAETVLFPSIEIRDWSKFFKRGDVVYNPNSKMLAIFDGWANDDYTEFNTTINYYKDHTFGEEEVCDTECFVKANDEQKTLFIAAAERYYGGKYNPETLQVEPVKVIEPKCSLKPFDKVLVRDSEDGVWKAGYFSNYDEDDVSLPYICVGSLYKLCIPYEGNEYLLGTDKSPE